MIVYIENYTKEFFNFRGYKKLIAEVIDTVSVMKDIPSDMEVNVMITDPDSIRQINRQSRGIDRATDVLSFPYFDFAVPGNTEVLKEAGPETILGDIVLCAQKVIGQAEEFGHSQKRELAYLVVHSMLHLIGFDHMNAEDEQRMSSEAESIMQRLAIAR